MASRKLGKFWIDYGIVWKSFGIGLRIDRYTFSVELWPLYFDLEFPIKLSPERQAWYDNLIKQAKEENERSLGSDS